VAVIAGLQAPLQATGTAIDAALSDPNGSARDAEFVHAAGITLEYIEKVLGQGAVDEDGSISSPSALAQMQASADAERIAEERPTRLWQLLVIAACTLAILIVVGLISWRTLVAAVAGTVIYAAVYNALFFFVHGFRWSLSIIGEEDLVQAFFNQRMLEAALAGLAGCLLAALVYLVLRRSSRETSTGWTAEWLAVGGATVLLMQAALAVQVGVFLWRWGASVIWILPDLREAFKYDLDLIQITALGVAAVLGPLLTYLFGLALGRKRTAPA
jgi:glucan phosphoethanolaminetransferase (alkaline phosphatase superfamily)